MDFVLIPSNHGMTWRGNGLLWLHQICKSFSVANSLKYIWDEKWVIYRSTSCFSVAVEASVTWHPGHLQWPTWMLTGRNWRHGSQNRRQICEKCLHCTMWPSRQGLCISMEWLRLKGCHVVCDECVSCEMCSLPAHVTAESVMWTATSH